MPGGGGRGHQVPDGTSGLPGDLVQSRGDLGAEPLVAVLGHRAGGPGKDIEGQGTGQGLALALFTTWNATLVLGP